MSTITGPGSGAGWDDASVTAAAKAAAVGAADAAGTGCAEASGGASVATTPQRPRSTGFSASLLQDALLASGTPEAEPGVEAVPEETLAELFDQRYTFEGRSQLLALASDPHGHPETLARLAGFEPPHNDLLKAIGKNPQTPSEVLNRLASDESLDVMHVRMTAADNPNMGADVLASLVDDEESLIRSAVLLNPSTPPEVLASKLETEDGPSTLVIENPNLAPELLATLADHPADHVRRGVAENPGAPPALLAKLGNDRSAGVICAVIRNPATSPEQLAQIADRLMVPDQALQSVASHPLTPKDTLARLATDQTLSQDVRLAAIRNRALDPDVLRALQNDPEEWARWNVTNNPSAPPDLLAQLAGSLSADEAWPYRDELIRHPNLPADSLRALASKSTDIKQLVAQNPNTPPDVLAELAGGRKPLRAAVASNPAATPQLLLQLAQRADKRVGSALVRNPNIPLAAMKVLASHEESEIRSGVAVHTTSPEILTQLAADEGVRSAVANNEHTPVKVLAQLAKDDSELVRGNVLENPRTPTEVLRFLAFNTGFQMHNRGRLVAQHPNASTELLREMANHRDEWVNSPPELQLRLKDKRIQDHARDELVKRGEV